MNVLIIEDHPLIIAGVKAILFTIDPAAVLKEAESFPEGLKMLDMEPFEIVILDLDVPGGESIGMIEQIRARQKDISVLVHSGYEEGLYAIPYLRAGADGYISKHASHKELMEAIHAMIGKSRFISQRVQQQMLESAARHNEHSQLSKVRSLSDRERIVVQLISEGKWTKEIAAIMGLKQNTISTYKKRIFAKLNVRDEIELTKKTELLKQLQ